MSDRASLAAKIALDNRAKLNLLAEKVRELGEISAKSAEKEPVIVRGIDGRDGKDGKDAPKVTEEQIKTVAFQWLSDNISQPKDGEKGEKGEDGTPAPQITAADIQLAVDLWFSFNADSLKGDKGDQGERGAKGATGDKGADGQAPAHEWKGTAIRFKNPSGIWGKWVDLKGDAGASGGVVGGGSGSSGITEIIAGTNVTVDNTNPKKPIISAIGGDSAFDSDRPTTRVGIPSVTVGGATVAEFLEGYFYPATDLALSMNSLGGPYELGLERNLNLVATVTANDGIVSLRQFKQGATVISTEATDAMSETVSGIKDTVTYTAYVEYELSGSPETKSVSRTASFYAPSYYGVGAAGNENETWVKANLTKTIRANNDLTANFSPTLERYYFAYPQSMGAVTLILDPNNFDITSAFTQFTATFTLADGSSEDYYIYRNNDDTTQTSYQLRFS